MILPSIKYYFIALFIAYKIYYARLSVIFYIQMDFVHPCLSSIRKKELGCGEVCSAKGPNWGENGKQKLIVWMLQQREKIREYSFFNSALSTL